MKFKLAEKAASILLFTAFLSPNLAIANLASNGLSGCRQDSAKSTMHCHEKALESTKENKKSSIFQAIPFSLGGMMVSIFVIYVLYNVVMIVILIGRLIFFQISSLLKRK